MSGRLDTPEEPLSAALPTRIITYAWGEKYVEALLSLALPAVLAPGNLPYVASAAPCEFVILTQERFFATVTDSPVVARIRELCPVRLIGLDDLVTTPDKYGMTLTYALHRGFADLGPTMTESWLLFLNADFILAAGSWRNLLTHLARGERLVASPSYCVKTHEVVPELRKRVDLEASRLCIAPREMADLVLRHRHNTIRGKTVNERHFSMRYMDQFYWLVDEHTLVGHQMPVSIVGMRPERRVGEPHSFWDHGLMREFCPEAEVHVIGDSDEFLMMELRERDVAADQIAAGWPSAREMGELMVIWVTPYQREFAHRPLTLHAADVPAHVEVARGQLRSFVDEVLSYAPANLPSHVDHPQWRYHRPTFMEARHKYLSARLGTITETSPPPEALSELDRAWWKLDGLEKAHARKCGEIAKAAARRRQLVHEHALGALAGLEIGGAEGQGPPRLFQHIVMEREAGPQSGAASRHHEFVKQALAHLDEQEERGLHSLVVEFEAARRLLQLDYERLLDRSIKSASIPPVTLRRGPITDTRPSPAGGVRGLGKRLYYRLFGRLPRVRHFHPYWAAMRHLIRVVDTEAARGARNVLTVAPAGGVVESVANHLPGLHAWVSTVGVKSGNFARAFDHPREFDLCICELEVAELSELSEIFGTVRPFVRSGGKMVAFHLNAAMERSSVDSVVSAGLSGFGDKAHVYYAGSAASARIVRDFLAAAANYRAKGYGSWVRGAAALLTIIPRALMANRAEATTPMDEASVEPGSWTSITVEVEI